LRRDSRSGRPQVKGSVDLSTCGLVYAATTASLGNDAEIFQFLLTVLYKKTKGRLFRVYSS
jgi:hypothetical protein